MEEDAPLLYNGDIDSERGLGAYAMASLRSQSTTSTGKRPLRALVWDTWNKSPEERRFLTKLDCWLEGGSSDGVGPLPAHQLSHINCREIMFMQSIDAPNPSNEYNPQSWIAEHHRSFAVSKANSQTPKRKKPDCVESRPEVALGIVSS